MEKKGCKIRMQLGFSQQEYENLEKLKQVFGVLNENDLLKMGLAELYRKYVHLKGK